ncbi:MAG TPA: hypothetical protein VNK23_11485 [Candidatus Dormibacteraeota bacterium]|nr:hypothetical protein [Candidatus Dormibacteraeota bacterium]
MAPQPSPERELSGLARIGGSLGSRSETESRAASAGTREISDAGTRSARRSAIRNHAIAFLLFLALGFVFTLPGSLSLGSGLLGFPGDNFQHAWFLWHFARSVVHAHNPFYTRLLYYPSRVNLAWSTTDPLAGLLALPLSIFAGPVVAYNLSLILQLALAAFCARLFCLRISRNETAAFIGGMIFGFSPFLMAEALAHLSLVTAFPIPLFVLALDRIFSSESGSWRLGIPLGLALLLAAFAHYNYAVICLVFAALLLAIEIARHFASGALRFIGGVWKPICAGAATFLVGFSPLLWMMLGMRSDVPGPRRPGHIEVMSADAIGFAIPSWDHIFFGKWAHGLNPDLFLAGVEGTVYIGAMVLALAVLGFCKGRDANRRWAANALILGIAFWLLSLGPQIHVWGHALRVPGPAALFFDLPFAKFISAPARFDVVVALCLGILCSLGVRYLIESPNVRKHRYWLVPVVAMFIMADYLTIPFPRASTVDPGMGYHPGGTRANAGSCALPPQIQRGTILTFPMIRAPFCLKSMWMQAASGGKFALVDGYLSYTPPEIWKPFWNIRILRSLMSIEGLYPAPIDTAADRASAAATIRELNLGAIVIYDSPEADRGASYIEEVFGVKPQHAGNCTIFPLRKPESPHAASGGEPPK